MKELETISSERGSRIMVLRWFARMWGLVVILFVGWFLFMHLFSDDPGSLQLDGAFEVFRFTCFPLSLLAGLMLAWKFELFGGLLAAGGILAFHAGNLVVLGQAEFDWLITGFAIPGLVHVLVWKLDRVVENET